MLGMGLTIITGVVVHVLTAALVRSEALPVLIAFVRRPPMEIAAVMGIASLVPLAVSV